MTIDDDMKTLLEWTKEHALTQPFSGMLSILVDQIDLILADGVGGENVY